MPPCDVIWRHFPFKHMYFSKIRYFVISPLIIAQFMNQGYLRVQFTQKIPLKQEIHQISDPCKFSTAQASALMNIADDRATPLTKCSPVQ